METNSLTLYDELSGRIVHSPKFEIYYDLVKNEILHSLDLATNGRSLNLEEIKFLVESAAILACSSKDENKQLAYYIVILVHSQYRQYYDYLASIIELILVRLGNFPAHSLLRKGDKNTFIVTDVLFNLGDIPLPLKYESLMKRELNRIDVDGREILLTDFQRDLFDNLSKDAELSFAAPTSAGKSFMLVLYISSLLKAREKLYVAYVVPTKALINQVKRDLKKHFEAFGITDVRVLSSTVTFELEWVERATIDKCILVLTQERLNYLLGNKEIDFPIDILIIDEAQKISDANRGIILERTIIKAIKQNIAAKVIFSAPLASNPDFFRIFKDTIHAYRTNYSPVAQNIIFVSSQKKNDFLTILFGNQKKTILKESDLVGHCPNGDKARSAYWAYHLGKGDSNIIYANGAADTESMAALLCKYLPTVKHKKIDDFIDFIKEEIHRDYSLVECLRKGVVFHYSTMPREIKDRVEELFADNEVPVKYMCCTSTLLEGMNLPAKNIFINKPRRGMTKKMEMFDFWNLAGRAGRLLQDLYGNIYCIDVDEWLGYVPESSIENYLIESATEQSINKKTHDIIRYLDNPKEPFPEKERELLEQTVSTFVLDYLEDEKQTIERFIEDRRITGINRDEITKISSSIQRIVSENVLPSNVLEKNSSVDSRLQNELYTFFGNQYYLDLLPRHPASGKTFYDSVLNIFTTINHIFLNETDTKMLRRYAFLASHWINEEPLATLIVNDISYLKKEGKFTSVNHCVRRIVDLIENALSYKYAKYTKCYIDILEYYLQENGYDVPVLTLPVYLELGAYRNTTISLLSFGLSRSTAIRLRRFIGSDDLNRGECREWLNNYYYRTKGHLPIICQEDYERNFT